MLMNRIMTHALGAIALSTMLSLGAACSSESADSDGSTASHAESSGGGAGGSGGSGRSGSQVSAGEADTGGSAIAGGNVVSLLGGPRGMWVWQTSTVTDSAARTALFNFCSSHQITTVFVESQGFIAGNSSSLGPFVQAAASKGIAVELLFGSSAWARAANHSKAVKLAHDAVQFSKALSGSRPVGLHFDVEPYTLPEWKSAQASIAGQWVDLLIKLRAETAGSGLRLSADVPFWLDGISLTRSGTTRPLHKWVIDAVDRAVIMDYRDHAAPPDGIIDLASAEVAYGKAVGKPVLIGVETICGLSPTKITFCEEGSAKLDKALNDAQAALDPGGLAGFAVHHYTSYLKLKP
ncbi:MAG: hypothetical protein ACMG6S_04265 [Byssovorax sp.]